MKTYEFVVREHEEYGSLGFAMRGRSWADPVGGLGVAHDILEHFESDDGSTEHELAALGATLFVRNESEYYLSLRQIHTRPADNISSDFPQQAYYLRDAGRTTLRKAPRHRRADDWVELELAEIYQRGRKLCREEDVPTEWLRDRTAVIGWMRHGYVMAERRYKQHTPSELCWLFQQIEAAVDREMNHAFEGQEFTLRLDINRLKFTLEADEDDDDE